LSLKENQLQLIRR